MCVIAYGRKSLFKTTWFQQCCDHNPDGFFVARANTGEHIRTLKYEEALTFFNDSKASDRIVLHARIKSVGPINANNVHGWEDSGLRFCHNGTLSLNVKDNLTDSETIFRQVIAPLYRANRNRMTKALKSAIEVLVGSSRFLIIDRQGKVYTFGKFTEKEGCLFSNTYWDTSAKTSWYDDYYGVNWRAAVRQTAATMKPVDPKTWTPVTNTTATTTATAAKSTQAKPKTPGSILPPRLLLAVLLKRFGKDGIDATMLSQILPAHSFISTTVGARSFNERALRIYLKTTFDSKTDDKDVDALIKTIKSSATTEFAMPMSVKELRRWLKDYALVVLSALRPLVEDDLYFHTREILGLMLRFADGSVPDSYLESLSQTNLFTYSNYATVQDSILATRGVYLPDVFYILYNLHVAIGRCYASIPTGASFPQESERKIRLFKAQIRWLERSAVFEFLTDPSADPIETLDYMLDMISFDTLGTYFSIFKSYPNHSSYSPTPATSSVTDGLSSDAVAHALFPCCKTDTPSSTTNPPQGTKPPAALEETK